MSIFSVHARKHTAYYDHLMSTSRTPSKERKPTDRPLGKTERTSEETAADASRISDESQQVNRTYVISAASKGASGQQTPYRGRLTLQRRSRRNTGAEATEKTVTESSHNTTAAPEKRLTLQRRSKAPSVDKRVYHGLQQTHKVLSEPNGRAPLLFRSASLKETRKDFENRGRAVHTPSILSRQPEDQAQSFKTPTKKTPFEKIALKRDVFEKLAMKEVPKPAAVKPGNVERPKSRAQQAEDPPVPALRTGKAPTGVQRPQAAPSMTKVSNQKGDVTQTSASTAASAPTSTEQTLSRPSEALKKQDPLKMENSAVTVAVRVRPFSARFVMICVSNVCPYGKKQLAHVFLFNFFLKGEDRESGTGPLHEQSGDGGPASRLQAELLLHLRLLLLLGGRVRPAVCQPADGVRDPGPAPAAEGLRRLQHLPVCLRADGFGEVLHVRV